MDQAFEPPRSPLLMEIIAAPDLAALLGLLGRELLASGLDGYMVHLRNHAGTALTCEAARLPEPARLMERTYVGGRLSLEAPDASIQVFRQGQPLRLDASTIGQHPGPTALRFPRLGMHTLLIHPLEDHGQPIGTVMAFTCGQPPSPAAEQALEVASRLFQPALARALAHAWLQRREQEILAAEAASRSVFEYLERVNQRRSVATVLEAASRQFLEFLGFDFVMVHLLEDGRLVPRHAAVRKPCWAHIPAAVEAAIGGCYPMQPEEGASVVALQQDTPLFFADLPPLLNYAMARRDRDGLLAMESPRSFAILPMVNQGQAVGVLWLITLEQLDPLAENRRDLLTRLARFTGSAIASARVYEALAQRDQEIEALNHSLREKVEQLRVLAYQDSLTGLHNFGAFQQELARRMSEYDRDQAEGQLAVIIIDVDHFKDFNDTHGHLAGNEALRQMAERIREVARRMDLPCRYGGEEFVVVLPRCDLEGAAQFAERLRQRVAEKPFLVAQKPVAVTVSIGCTCFRPGESMDAFLKRADAALYRAKAAGRNRVVVAPADSDFA